MSPAYEAQRQEPHPEPGFLRALELFRLAGILQGIWAGQDGTAASAHAMEQGTACRPCRSRLAQVENPETIRKRYRGGRRGNAEERQRENMLELKGIH